MTAQTTAPVGTGLKERPLNPRRRSKVANQGQANWAVKVVMVLLCIAWLIPTVGLLVTSFRSADAALNTGWWSVIVHPLSNWTLSSYHDVLVGNNLGSDFINSLAVCLPATFIPILIAAFAAYAFTFMQFPGRDVLFVIIVGLLIVPNQVAFVPLLKIYGSLHLNGTYAAVWLAHSGFAMSLAIYLLRNYMATLPRAIIESAKIDGASHFATFWRLILPMSVPALASFAIFQFLWVWNDLLVALIFLGQGDKATVTVGLSTLVGNQGQGWQLLTSAAFLTMIVPLIFFLSLQRFFIRGLTAGSVKG